jgi:predicted TIM-barrel fold metal-dependent hydrolase
MKIMDPHLHLFNLDLGEYHWLKPNSPPFWPDKSLINKSFDERSLTLQQSYTLEGFVHIEAGFNNNKPWCELDVVEKTCKKPLRTISSINLKASSDEFKQCLEKLAQYHSFVGVRHILDEQALEILTNKQVLDNFSFLNNFTTNTEQNLIFEVQLQLLDKETTYALCDVIKANQNIKFILNHAGFPPADIQTTQWLHWQQNLLKLSVFSQIAIKCSGWEMNNRNYQSRWLDENLAEVFNIFGKDRMMLASNFPLCLFSKENYWEYWNTIITSKFFQALTEQEKSALCYHNTLFWYFA